MSLAQYDDCLFVSIHARIADGRCRPAAQVIGQTGCFNPRPSLQTGDAVDKSYKHVPFTFQSTPAIADGRCFDTQ